MKMEAKVMVSVSNAFVTMLSAGGILRGVLKF